MRDYRINADVVSVTKDHGVLALGFSDTVAGQGQPIYLLLQRAGKDKAIYVEVNDQINSGYDLITAIADGPGELTIKVKPEFRQLGSPETIRVTYAVTDRNAEAVREGLKQIMDET